jgi:hypothetical protein
MRKRRPPKQTSKPKKQNTAHKPAKIPRSRLKQAAEWLLGMATVGGFVVGLLIFLPRVTVSSPVTTDPDARSPIPFEITNSGYLPLYDVKPMLGLCEIHSQPAKRIGTSNGPLLTKFAPSFWQQKSLTMDERATVRFDDVFEFPPPSKFGGADISIIVSYRPWILPFMREKEFRFITRQELDGKISWLSIPVNR